MFKKQLSEFLLERIFVQFQHYVRKFLESNSTEVLRWSEVTRKSRSFHFYYIAAIDNVMVEYRSNVDQISTLRSITMLYVPSSVLSFFAMEIVVENFVEILLMRWDEMGKVQGKYSEGDPTSKKYRRII